ncbi:MAG: rhomboid family intramembrane serine protease, partial [Myxococcota bacterium]
MFPIRDDNPHFLTPVATYGIIALNVVMWLFVQGVGTEPSWSRSLCMLGLVPGELMQTLPVGAAFPHSPTAVS